ncbi:MAG TPA: hypothetical protein VGO43_12540 [Pyrinomonadaceae bacterium]|jgi:hypothetical protein|nr:hypothetical protein [Pyrinomonadaceae bacterium]
MKRSGFTLLLVFFLTLAAFSQKDPPAAVVSTVAADNAVALELAKNAVVAHGGDKFKQMKSVVLKGTVDVNVGNQIQTGSFSTAISGNMYYFEISLPTQAVKQIFNGEQLYASVPQFMIPPPTSVGFEVLARVGDAGYLVTKHGDDKKKGKGFRITTPDGFYTDFTVDEKSGQINGFQSSFLLPSEITVTTSAEMSSFQTVDGVLLPKKYSQRFDFGAMMAYATFQIKDTKVNPPIDATAFAIPK